MYASINKQLLSYSKLFRHSIPALPGKELKDIFSFQMSLWATEHCVMGNMLPASYRLSGPALHYARLGKEGKEIKTEVM
jgi:hypothetical protein